jgi:hypothetical protein
LTGCLPPCTGMSSQLYTASRLDELVAMHVCVTRTAHHNKMLPFPAGSIYGAPTHNCGRQWS